MNYLQKLDLSEEWKETRDGIRELPSFCEVVADKLDHISLQKCKIKKLLLDDLAWMRRIVIDQFFDLAEEDSITIEEFDKAMEKLHEWADYSHCYNLKSCEIIM